MSFHLPERDRTAWSSVIAISVSVAVLITAELLPVSLLTPIARDLGITEGLAGQTLTATACTAIVASLITPKLVQRLNRRPVVMSLCALLVLSSALVALSSQLAVMLFGRVLLGLALGAFWALSASLALRLARPADVPRVLSLLYGGVSVALVLAAPAGSYLVELIGWRHIFTLTAVLGGLCWLWQALTLPSMPARSTNQVGTPWGVLARPGVTPALLANFLAFAGQFAIFSYIRPFLEQVTHQSSSGVTATLLVFGVANFFGTLLASPLLKYSLRAALIAPPFLIALCAAGLCLLGQHLMITTLLVASWGFFFGAVPVSWSAWITQRLSDDAENAGGMQVAAIQAANTLGAAVGGCALDWAGPRAPMFFGGTLLAMTSVVVCLAVNEPVPSFNEAHTAGSEPEASRTPG